MIKPTKINDLDFVEKLKLEEEFFSRPFMMSYSGLSKLAYSPGAFYLHYILKQKEDTVDKAMAEGSLIHCMILTPEKFEDFFVVLPDTFPSDNPKKVMERLRDHIQETYPSIKNQHDMMPYMDNIGNAVIDILKDENLYQSLKTDAQRIDKIFTEKNMDYLEFLLKCKDKMVVERPMVEFAQRAREEIMSKPYIRELMGFTDSPGITSFNELTIAQLPDAYAFGLKGIVDNMVVDHNAKVIRINDLKKTSKAAGKFEESIDYYQYWMQAAIYKKIIDSMKEAAFGVNYPVEFRFIVIDPYLHVVPLLVSEVTMSKFTEMTDDILHIANHHFLTKDFSAPFGVLTSEKREIVI